MDLTQAASQPQPAMPQGGPTGGLEGLAAGAASPTPQGGHAGGFTGTVEYQGQKFEVKNGVAEVEGQRFIVSDDGRLVVDEKGQLVAIIQNGQIVQPTPEIIDQLKQEGVFGDGKPQGTPVQTP